MVMNAVLPTNELVETHNGVKLRVLTWTPVQSNTQSPILLVHGLASNSLLWQGTAHELVNMGHVVKAVDLRGHGLSEKPDDGYDMQSVTNDVAGLLRTLAANGFERPVVIGQSWGGNVVVELAHKYPELVRGVVAVDGGFLELQEHFPQWEECSVALRPPNLLGTPVSRMRGYMEGAHPDWPKTGIDGSMANFEQLPDGTIRPWLTLDRHLMVLRGLWEHKPTHIYKDITVPVMFVPAGGPGGVFSDTKRHAVERALDSVPKVRVEWFSSADHDLHAQHPVRFAQVVHAATTDGFFT